MIRKLQYILAAMGITASMYACSIQAYASMADMVNQQLEANEEEQGTDTNSPQESQQYAETGVQDGIPTQAPSEAPYIPSDTVGAETEGMGTPNGSYTDVNAVIDAINMLDPPNPDEYLINVIRASYDALPMSLQIQVTNINTLLEAEANLETVREGGELPSQGGYNFREGTIDGNPHTETGENPYSGTEYTFNVRQETNEEGLTLFIRFQEDLNGDGMGDTPSIAVMYPDAAEEIAMMNSTSLSRDNANLTWAGEYLQIDIAHPSVGLWTISTSLKCVFEVRSYAGIPETFISEEEKDTRQTSNVFVPVNDSKSAGGMDIKAILLLAAVGAGIVAAIVVFLRALLPQKPKASKEKKGQTAKSNKKSQKGSSKEDETSEAEAAKDEELRKIRADMEKENKLYEKEDADYAAMQKKKAEMSEERIEEELDITVEDIDNDDAIEEYTDGFDTGILSKNWNDDGTTGDTGTLNSRFGK